MAVELEGDQKARAEADLPGQREQREQRDGRQSRETVLERATPKISRLIAKRRLMLNSRPIVNSRRMTPTSRAFDELLAAH